MSNSQEVILFSLGLEELALSLSIINRADMGRELLASVYDDLTEEQMDARLSSASHSMLARGLAAITRSGSPALESRLEQALFPLVRFDMLLQLSVVKGDAQHGSTIHVQRGKSFTSHSVQGGVVHVLEFGPDKMLNGFLEEVFDSKRIPKTRSKDSEWTITPGVLGLAVGLAMNQKEIQALFEENHVPGDDAKLLAEDLANQKERGTILKVNANQSYSTQALEQAPKEMLMFLSSSKRSWIFTFPATDDAVKGYAKLVDEQSFGKALASFIK